MKKKELLFFVVSSLFLLSSCSKKSSSDGIPAFIQIPYFTTVTDTLNQGTSIQNYTDVWLYNNNEFLGCFPIGTKIPILADGNTLIRMGAGIKNGGVSDLRSYYPLMHFYETNINLVRGKVASVVPEFNYFTGISFLKLEDFSQAGTFLAKSASSDTFLVKYTGAESIAGQGYCAHVYLNDTYRVFDVISGASIPYSLQTSNCYLEIQYKSNIDLTISVSDGNTDIRPVVTLLAQVSPNWKKVYVPLISQLNGPYWLANFYFVMHASVPGNGTIGEIYFDNIKIIRQ